MRKEAKITIIIIINEGKRMRKEEEEENEKYAEKKRKIRFLQGFQLLLLPFEITADIAGSYITVKATTKHDSIIMMMMMIVLCACLLVPCLSAT